MPGIPDAVYRTGDVGRCGPDGELEFIGRIDHQVKIRDHRVEIGEIEAQLELHPAVSEAVVVLREQDDPVRAHCAAFTVSSGTTPAQLRRWLGARLPSIMLPRHVTIVEGLSSLPAGKLDRVRIAREMT